ncbi:MAG: UDP-N-acetylmuramyl-tripeptide synthetase [Planctomycetota bacterium]|jgi:UDP-N-acetylmuramoyl-L-alanyl-D-glutamate--2,6-diaminopimelate ligase|nr:UDP-N-acetylmuramyl-tripeptide synthetase [Planctomycetota bacterium]
MNRTSEQFEVKTRLARLRGQIFRVGITGTNGKTTTTSMLDSIISASGELSARLDTLGGWIGGECRCQNTMEWIDFLETAVAEGVRTMVFEMTSNSLSRYVSCSWPPSVGVITNITRDHFGHHGGPEGYMLAKGQLLQHLPPGGTAVLNAGDPASARMVELVPGDVQSLSFAVGKVNEAWKGTEPLLLATTIEMTREGTRAVVEGELGLALGGEIQLRTHGEIYLENAFAAALAAHALGYSANVIRKGLESFSAPPGRFEIVADQPLVVVDFATSPDALARTIAILRSLVRGRVICVFGCGGGASDPDAREILGRVAHKYADVVVLTNDNPRDEDPEQIADAVSRGARGEGARWIRELDRRLAIDLAFDEAEREDSILLAGKGPERNQVIGTEVRPFSDVEVTKMAWQQFFGDSA